MDIQTILLFLLGLGFLIGGADLLVRGAVEISAALKISPLVIGLTVVAFGTASPELAVSIESARAGHSDISVGNIVGSNILNILVILGLSALVMPLFVKQQLVRLEVPIMIGVSVLLVLVCLDGRISRADGMVLGACLIGYLYVVSRFSGRESRKVREEYEREYSADKPRKLSHILLYILMLVAGLAALFIGTPWFTGGAIAFARVLGVSERIISLTIVSIGTSLPELATSVLASLRGERDIAVGNVVGRNIFNILAVLGIASVVSGGIDVTAAALRFDMPIMVAAAILCLPVFFTGRLISRREGLLFLGYYALYMIYLLLSATGHSSLGLFGRVAFLLMIVSMIPLIMAVIRDVRSGQGSGA